MSESKHTPGPWSLTGSVKPVADEHGTTMLYCGYIETGGPYRGTVAGIQSADHIGGISREEAEANGRLIAAAPSLHEAMEPFASMPDDPSRPDDAMTGMRISYGELRRAKRALSLSEGRAI